MPEKEQLARDYSYMRLAIKLAERGRGRTTPNLVAGAVIVRDNRILGVGFRAAKPAERNAFDNCTQPTRGATLYITMEPDSQPDDILQAGIARVVTGSDDPRPLVAGQAVRVLRDRGVRVDTGFMRDECDALNPVFFHYVRTRQPYCVLSYALTLDGQRVRRDVRGERDRYAAALVGAGTVAAENPLLDGDRKPVRIVCDSHLRTSTDCQLVRTARDTRTVFVAVDPDPERRRAFENAGCEVWTLSADHAGRVNLCALADRMGHEELDSVLIEGGASLARSALQAGIVRRVQAHVVPEFNAFPLRGAVIAPSDDDFLLEGDL